VKKIWTVIGCLLIAGVLLAGCGGGSGSNNYGQGEGGPGPEPGTTTDTGTGSGTTAVDPKVQQCRDNITDIYSAIVDYRMRNGGTTPRNVSSLAGLLSPMPVEPFGGTYTITEDPDSPMGVTVTCSLGHDQY
jgi:hypothetical protein